MKNGPHYSEVRTVTNARKKKECRVNQGELAEKNARKNKFLYVKGQEGVEASKALSASAIETNLGPKA